MSYDVSNKKQIAAQCAALYGIANSEETPAPSTSNADLIQNAAVNMNIEGTSQSKGLFYGAKLSNCTININFQ